MSLTSDVKPVTDFLHRCQALCQQVNTTKTKVELWPYRGLESQVFSLCLSAAAALAQHQVVTISLCHCDGICVAYPVMLLQSLVT